MKLRNKSNLPNQLFYPVTTDKKAQIGETITWLVATVIIIVILIFSIFVTGLVGKNKEFQILPKKDLLATKSLSSYLLTQDDSGKKVFEQLKDKENLDEFFNNFSGPLAVRVFKGLYKKDYPYAVWFGFDFEGFGIRKNDYFGTRPIDVRGGDISKRFVSFISEEIYFNTDKYLRLILMEK